MEAKDLRSLNVDELKARVKQWGDELFRTRFKAGSTEAKDTSIFKKLRKDIARAQTVMNEKLRSGEKATTSSSAAPAAPTSEKKATKNSAPEDKVEAAGTKKPAAKKKSSTKSKE